MHHELTAYLFFTGRVYIGQSEVMMKELITCLKSVSEKTKTGENLLGAMQKLSLRYVIAFFISILRGILSITGENLLLVNLSTRCSGR